MSDQLVIAGRAFNSRLIVGTGKYRSFQEMARAHAASGADMVTVAVRRVNLTDKSKESLLDYIDREKIFILPNTAACYTADEAIRTARLAREVGLSNWVKLEVIGDQQTLFPDTEQLIEATRVLVKEGFIVLPYTNDDLIAARKLIDAGASAVMPLAAPIGSGLGIQNPANLRILRERITEVPMIVDAGVGTASDAAVAMELGADGVLMNTAIAEAADAVLMAEAMRDAVVAGTQSLQRGPHAQAPLRVRLVTSRGRCPLVPCSASHSILPSSEPSVGEPVEMLSRCLLTRISPAAIACAAIHRSLFPITLRDVSNSARIVPYFSEVSTGKGSTGSRSTSSRHSPVRWPFSHA